MGGLVGQQRFADLAAVEAVRTASRSLIALAARSLGAAAEETTIAQYRTLMAFARATGEVPAGEWPQVSPASPGATAEAASRQQASRAAGAGGPVVQAGGRGHQ